MDKKVPDVSLRQLKSALFVADYSNVTKATSKLNRSQTAVTKAIADLETSLGVSLFDRSSRGMILTEYGKTFISRAKLAAHEFDSAGKSYQAFKPNARSYQSNPVFSLDISHKRFSSLIALFEHREINSAANSLGITKAAIYNSIRQLEELLDLQLFESVPKGLANFLLHSDCQARQAGFFTNKAGY